jgi:hypothetical protein
MAESIKTTIMLDEIVLRRAESAAALAGISLSAFITNALLHTLDGTEKSNPEFYLPTWRESDPNSAANLNSFSTSLNLLDDLLGMDKRR